MVAGVTTQHEDVVQICSIPPGGEPEDKHNETTVVQRQSERAKRDMLPHHLISTKHAKKI